MRRFFQPWLLTHDGDHNPYYGQQINAAGDGSAGSVNDPNWNAGADPRWSPDGTRITYYQMLVVPPACGGKNPLPCPVSTAQGGRTYRLMLATLTSRKPLHLEVVAPISDVVPWGIPYFPGQPAPTFSLIPQGNYKLKGKASGYADVKITLDVNHTYVSFVGVTYYNFSDDGANFIVGSENVTGAPVSLTATRLDWYSNLTSTGASLSTKMTSPGGFHLAIDTFINIFEANGTLMTTVDGVVYKQPDNET
jgi:hypothetical protein